MMSERRDGARATRRRLVAFVAARRGRLLLALGERERWRGMVGYTLLPLELPGDEWRTNEPLTRAQTRILADRLTALEPDGARLLTAPSIYGPSARHVIDRRPARTDEEPAPLLTLERGAPLVTDDATDDAGRESKASALAFQPVEARVYRIAPPSLVGEGSGGRAALWLTPEALRLAVRGLPLAELLARDDVAWALPLDQPPENAFVYIPSEYGERYLLRALAKYGWDALFPDAEE